MTRSEHHVTDAGYIPCWVLFVCSHLKLQYVPEIHFGRMEESAGNYSIYLCSCESWVALDFLGLVWPRFSGAGHPSLGAVRHMIPKSWHSSPASAGSAAGTGWLGEGAGSVSPELSVSILLLEFPFQTMNFCDTPWWVSINRANARENLTFFCCYLEAYMIYGTGPIQRCQKRNCSE